MNKAYSNKALPAGTVLREWRLEEVLGVGGFGIVYKGRGIYFDELVAIKEYFPSAISERDEEDTVVPIDSDAEEVHALGLKKFVEEAKLLWNLSTPSRHPNIVSVRSLFEIHGTAYMVMDFEDGNSLSRLLKDGTRFNERSLWDIIRPIAEGLDRAHRVGVLHRDIKPPNILITADGRPVLIDFGSARFDTADATSTTVTFHTPPYAAVEQYVKTYAQGPWTDIYALGVVLYECVTGTKPPEVLERLHGGLGEPLAAKKWPGYSKRFLAAIDSAMTIKPSERPQSMSEWLAQFDEDGGESDEDDEKTRFYAHEVETPEIVPVAPPADGANIEAIDSKVPDRPSAAEFKRAGIDTHSSRKHAKVSDAVPQAVAAAAVGAKSDKPVGTEPAPATAPKPRRPTADAKRKASPAVMGGVAAVVIAGALGGWFVLGHRTGTPADQIPPIPGAASATPNAQPVPAPTAVDANLSPESPSAATPDNGAAASPTAPPDRAQAKAKLAAVAQVAPTATRTPAKKPAKTPETAKPAATKVAAQPDVGVTPAKMAQFNSIVAEGRTLAKQVRRSGNSANSALAKNYDKYLVTLKDSMRGVTTAAGADQLIRQASQTRAYLQFLAAKPSQ